MKAYEFIFSNDLKHRLQRHSIFWLCFILYFYYVNLIPSKSADLLNSKTYLDAFKLMIYLPVSVISVYVAIYILLPKYILKEKYFALLLTVTGLTIIYFFIAFLLTVLLARLTGDIPFQQLPVAFKWFQPVRYGIGLPLTSAVITTIIKLFKNWQHEQKENELLQRKKINTEMQLLKTYFQPHFLYDSLEQLHQLIQSHSTQTPDAVLHLSDLLSYVLYENEKEKVALAKELEIVKIYLHLKMIFYSQRLEVTIKPHPDLTGISIAPLIILSLVENCIEDHFHNEAQTLFMQLEITLHENEMHFVILLKTNIKKQQNEKIENEQWKKYLKRIQLLYADKHSFNIQLLNENTRICLVLKHQQWNTGVQRVKENLISS